MLSGGDSIENFIRVSSQEVELKFVAPIVDKRYKSGIEVENKGILFHLHNVISLRKKERNLKHKII